MKVIAIKSINIQRTARSFAHLTEIQLANAANFMHQRRNVIRCGAIHIKLVMAQHMVGVRQLRDIFEQIG
ncbi:Uncharacterised protein [Vibrio cholerae]|uniref:Uncharacterized protein n=1 Tax=Vibrio cholerae TaxID=666 RepID=A0A656AME6_VIBCL|nr:Uncharacterised protein [Vibrio cholerae]CSD48072.1 Uncharacterised protein [Vibrio cholerae]CSI49496.1 Uncharacterised protein [Vibrio cholerae]